VSRDFIVTHSTTDELKCELFSPRFIHHETD